MDRLRRWGPLALAVTATLAATSLPVPAAVGDPFLAPWSDKVVHFLLYLSLGWSLGVGLWTGDSPGFRRFLAALVVAAAFAALDEWHQAWIPGRTPAILDWVADLVGAGAGLAVSLRLVPWWLREASGAESGGARPGGTSPAAPRAAPPGGSPAVEAVDLHTHLMPSVDDGARGPEAAGRAARELAGAGVRVAAATPHVDAATLAHEQARADRLAELDRGWEELETAAADAGADVSLRRGAEVRLNAPAPDLSDPRLRLGGSRAALVEFASLELPPHGGRQLAELAEQGWLPVLAHPARYRGIARRPAAIEEWEEAGAALQVNCGSLLGQYGREARTAAWRMLEEGRADLLATDWHARGPIQLAPAIRALRERGAGEQARMLLASNPRRILEGERPVPVPPLPPADSGLLARLRRAFGA